MAFLENLICLLKSFQYPAKPSQPHQSTRSKFTLLCRMRLWNSAQLSPVPPVGGVADDELPYKQE